VFAKWCREMDVADRISTVPAGAKGPFKDDVPCRSEMKRTATKASSTPSWGGYALDPLDRDRLQGDVVLKGPLCAGGNGADPVGRHPFLHTCRTRISQRV